MPRKNSTTELEELRKGILSKRDSNKPCIAICMGTGCLALGADRVISAFKEEIDKKSLSNELRKIPPLIAAIAINDSIITNKINGNRIVKHDRVILIL